MRAGALSAACWTDSPHQNNLPVQGVLVNPTSTSAWSRVENETAFCMQLVAGSLCVISTEYEGNSYFELKIPAYAGIPLVQSHAPLGKPVKQWFCCQIYPGDPTDLFPWSVVQVWGLVYHACSSASKRSLVILVLIKLSSVQRQCLVAAFSLFLKNPPSLYNKNSGSQLPFGERSRQGRIYYVGVRYVPGEYL